MGVFAIGTLLFWFFEKDREGGLTLIDALYYGIVTLSTVGYGDIYPLTTGGRWIAVGLIFFALFALGYLVTQISDAVLEARRMEELGMQGTKFENHLVLIGWNQIARVALAELVQSGRQIAIITDKADQLAEIREYGDKTQLFATTGNFAYESVLLRSGIARAATVIVCSDEDTSNLILTLNVRQLNPSARIICSVRREELRRTLHASGVTYVTNPFEFSGRMVASAAFEPEVARLIEDMSSGATGSCDLQQFSVGASSVPAGSSVADVVKLLGESDASLLISVARSGEAGGWKRHPNPAPDMKLLPDDVMVVLGTAEQNTRSQAVFGSNEGR